MPKKQPDALSGSHSIEGFRFSVNGERQNVYDGPICDSPSEAIETLLNDLHEAYALDSSPSDTPYLYPTGNWAASPASILFLSDDDVRANLVSVGVIQVGDDTYVLDCLDLIDKGINKTLALELARTSIRCIDDVTDDAEEMRATMSNAELRGKLFSMLQQSAGIDAVVPNLDFRGYVDSYTLHLDPELAVDEMHQSLARWLSDSRV